VSSLLIDVGNTRVKWARIERGKLLPQRAAAHAKWNAQDFAHNLFTRARGIERVVVASVAGERIERALASAARQRCDLAVEFFKTQRSAAGITTMYEQPWRLGVDRFAAAIGAHALIPKRAVCIVDVGTAATIDLIDARGVHRGGAIIPGPDLMVEGLLQDTSGILRRAASAASSSRTLFARNTRAAVEQGARYAIAAALDRAVEEARRLLGREPCLIVTGGAATSILKLIRRKHRLVPDLVLRGLAVAYDLFDKTAKVRS
jgi:type III pantothenate kinase